LRKLALTRPSRQLRAETSTHLISMAFDEDLDRAEVRRTPSPVLPGAKPRTPPPVLPGAKPRNRSLRGLPYCPLFPLGGRRGHPSPFPRLGRPLRLFEPRHARRPLDAGDGRTRFRRRLPPCRISWSGCTLPAASSMRSFIALHPWQETWQ